MMRTETGLNGANEETAMNTRLATAIVLGIAITIVPSFVGAQSIVGYPGYWGCYGPWSTYASESVPYFALHPPVYYSVPVARTYGYSPFPYPPGVLTPGSAVPQPIVIRNQYIEGAYQADTGRRQTQPLRIENPFIPQRDRSVSKCTQSPPHPPQVVYPAALAAAPQKSR
jgi:hypothetical protein